MNPKQKRQKKRKKKKSRRNNSRRIGAGGFKMERVFVLLYFCLIGFFCFMLFFWRKGMKLGGLEDGEDLGDIREGERI